MKGPSPGGHDRWERDKYRWEKDYADWYKYYDSQHPSLHHRGRGSRDRERDRMSPLARDYSPQSKGRRAREDRGAPPPHPPPSSSSGTKSSTKVLKTKKVKKKKTADDSEPSHQAVDRDDATPVRDEPMDEVPSLIKTSPMSTKPSPGASTTKASGSKSSAASAKSSTKSTSKTQADKSKKEKGTKVKAKVKTDGVKAKSDKLKKKAGEGPPTKKKDDASSSSTTKPLKTVKAKAEDSNSSTPKKEKSKSCTVRPPLLKTPPLSSQTLPLHLGPLHDGPRPGHDIRGRRDLPPGAVLHPHPHQHGPPLLHRPMSPGDSRRRMAEDGRSLLGPSPGKLRRMDGPGMGGDMLPLSHMSHQPPLHRLGPSSDRPGLLPIPGSRDMGRGDMDRPVIRPLMDFQVGLCRFPWSQNVKSVLLLITGFTSC